MKSLNIIFLSLFLLVFTYINAQEIPLNPDVKKGTLSNGMTYYIQKNDKPANEVQFRLIIKAGSILEDEDQRGFAHFLEHMAFNGSEHFPGNSLIDYFQSIGVQFGGDINAYTGYDETVYMLPVPNSEKETLDKAFYFFGDILGGLSLNKKDIDEERGIIHEEWRTTTGLGDRTRDKMYPLLYFKSRYNERLPIGLMDEVVLNVGNEEALRRFYKDWYRPDLATLLVVGDIDESEIEQRIKDTFGGKTNPVNERERVYYSVENHPNTLIGKMVDEEITSTSAMIINKMPKQKEETLEDLKTSVANILYTYMINQRLQEVAKTKDAPFMFASSYKAGGSGDKDRYMSNVSVKSGQVLEGLKGILNELYRAKKFGFSQAEFERKRAILAKDLKTEAMEQSSLKSSQYIGNLMSHVIYGSEYTSAEFKNDYLDKVIKEITVEDIEALAQQYIQNSPENRVVFINAPKGEKIPSDEEILEAINSIDYASLTPYQSEEVDGPLMEKEPVAGKVISTTKDEVLGTTTLTYENGAVVVIKPTTFKNDEIQFSGARDGGYSLASDEQFNNASLAASLVELGGLGKYNKQQLEKLIGDKQATVSTNINRYSETVGGKSTVEDFETMMQLTYMKFTAPRKDKEQFDLYISNKKEYNKNRLNDPDSYFADVINKTMFNNHPRVATLLTQDQIDALNLDDAYDFYTSRFSSVRGMHFVFVGNIDLATAQPLLDKYIGGLPGGEIVHNYRDNGLRVPKTKTVIDVAKSKSEKTKVIIRYQGKYPTGQDNRIKIELLGDVATIRLTKKLREELGGTYSPFAYGRVIEQPNNEFQFNIVFTCAPDQADTLQQVALQIVDDLKKEVKAEDLDKVKKTAVNHREKALERNNYWVALLQNANERNEGASEYVKYVKEINEVSQKDLQKAASKYLKNNKVFIFTLSPEKTK
ncbi:insulinase family protein [Flammeovirga yaeyamensis]|uniref:Insulinase family protein n=1 Tax=Flammeovirga yaeyamensis TaxID=367791 RepID=A0AAX1N1B7_9BACT|nr:M16 family metallopeptidase [Flammeovirga yaeyamensis]MBB3698509.1 zinc protease [Flammeovirga yaeyamensis]NMF34142.1 insulinase family protein [Flammeovirga yaeyamensis]QWG01127.1 insulinase family protein [Flammeovirga yaeyamensis]